jgi:hypothetical protein
LPRGLRIPELIRDVRCDWYAVRALVERLSEMSTVRTVTGGSQAQPVRGRQLSLRQKSDLPYFVATLNLPPVAFGVAQQFRAQRLAHHNFYHTSSLQTIRRHPSPNSHEHRFDPIPTMHKGQCFDNFFKILRGTRCYLPICSTQGSPKKKRMQKGDAQYR